MVRRIAPIGVVSFVLLAACGAYCQTPDQSLPDAPSVQIASGTQGFNILEKFRTSRIGATGGVERPMTAGGFSPIDQRFGRKDSSTVFDKYLSPSSVKLRSAYQFSCSDFGSTVGNDAGMNLLHEFAPNLQEVMKSHAPRFVSNLTARIGRN